MTVEEIIRNGDVEGARKLAPTLSDRDCYRTYINAWAAQVDPVADAFWAVCVVRMGVK